MKAITRRQHTSEEKISVVLEDFRREVTVNDLCRRAGIKLHSYYAWTKESYRRTGSKDSPMRMACSGLSERSARTVSTVPLSGFPKT